MRHKLLNFIGAFCLLVAAGSTAQAQPTNRIANGPTLPICSRSFQVFQKTTSDGHGASGLYLCTGTTSTDGDAAWSKVGPMSHQVSVTVTDAQIKALPDTNAGQVASPVVLVPAPGANKVIVPVAATILTKFSAGYVVGSPAYLTIEWGGAGSRVFARMSDGLSSILSFGGNQFSYFTHAMTPDGTVISIPASDETNRFENTSLKLTGAGEGSDWTGGDPANTMVVSVSYMILNIQTGLFE